MREQLIENLSWRVVCEIMRRYPDRFFPLELHPGGGLYDCLALCTGEGVQVMHFNRVGQLHIFAVCRGKEWHKAGGPVESIDYEQELKRDVSSRALIDRVCRAMGLRVPTQLPKGTASVMMARYISAFLAHTTFGRDRWRFLNGMCDTSGYGTGSREEYFAAISKTQKALGEVRPDNLRCFDAPYHFWFLLRNGEPRLCLSLDGRLWDCRSTEWDLMEEYTRLDRNLWRLVVQTAGDEMK